MILPKRTVSTSDPQCLLTDCIHKEETRMKGDMLFRAMERVIRKKTKKLRIVSITEKLAYFGLVTGNIQISISANQPYNLFIPKDHIHHT